MKQLKYGIISTASITTRFIKAVQTTSHSQVAAIASRHLAQAQQLATELGIPLAYGSYLELYQDPTIDIVYIATINEDHFPQMMLALQHGKHVVCEKPFVLASHQAKEVFAFAKSQQRFVMEAQKSVFLPITNAIKDIIINKSLGDLRQIDMTSSFSGRFGDSHWMYDPHQGGVLFGSASYTIEYLNYLLDMPPMTYQATGVKKSNGCIEAVGMQFLLDDQCLATSRISMNVITKNVATFYFDEGYIDVFDYWKARKARIVSHLTHKETWIEFPCDFEMVYEVDHIADCISAGLLTSPIMTPQMSIKSVEITEQFHQMIG